MPLWRSQCTAAAQSRETPNTPVQAWATGVSRSAGNRRARRARRWRTVASGTPFARSVPDPKRDGRPRAPIAVRASGGGGGPAAADRDAVVGGALQVAVDVSGVVDRLAAVPADLLPRRSVERLGDD